MSKLLRKLAELADQLDTIGAVKTADELDELIQEVSRREQEDAGALKSVCPECQGAGFTDDSPFCEMCKGEGEIALLEASLNKTALKPPYVRRRGNKWVVLDKHTGKVLSTHDTEEKAKGSLAAMHMHGK